MHFDRVDRVSEEVKKAISEIIQYELKDPRLNVGLISIVKVNLSKDLRYAKIYVSIFDNNPENIQSSLLALRNSVPYIRREIAKRIKLRYTSEITFELDDSIEYGARISEILNKLNIPKDNNSENRGEDSLDRE
ncbi:30S ribosome-binding factor RbfA [Caldicellulosiruptoraceae bacterium PP1]